MRPLLSFKTSPFKSKTLTNSLFGLRELVDPAENIKEPPAEIPPVMTYSDKSIVAISWVGSVET